MEVIKLDDGLDTRRMGSGTLFGLLITPIVIANLFAVGYNIIALLRSRYTAFGSR